MTFFEVKYRLKKRGVLKTKLLLHNRKHYYIYHMEWYYAW